jgi:hypothetical protein
MKSAIRDEKGLVAATSLLALVHSECGRLLWTFVKTLGGIWQQESFNGSGVLSEAADLLDQTPPWTNADNRRQPAPHFARPCGIAEDARFFARSERIASRDGHARCRRKRGPRLSALTSAAIHAAPLQFVMAWHQADMIATQKLGHCDFGFLYKSSSLVERNAVSGKPHQRIVSGMVGGSSAVLRRQPTIVRVATRFELSNSRYDNELRQIVVPTPPIQPVV